MSAQSWATKYRPTDFSEVVGQPEKAHLRQLLRQRGEIPPLFIFAGPSGTGKTTVARLFAQGLNCEDLGPKGDPCGTCVYCAAAQDGSLMALYEHNCALLNGAAHMRDLEGRAYLQPDAPFSVFILDEAQTLSSQAWRVLLKLFEEPPSGVVFVVVTSELHKIPEAIQTRALQYTFGRVQADLITSFVQSVLDREGASLANVDALADLAQGSVREAVMLAEQCHRAGIQDAQQLFPERRAALQAWEGLVAEEPGQYLVALEQLWGQSMDAAAVFEELATVLHDALYCQHGLPVYRGRDTLQRVKDLSGVLTNDNLAKCLNVMANWEPRVNSKAQLIFMWQALVTALGGEDTAVAATRMRQRAAVPQKVTPTDVKNALL